MHRLKNYSFTSESVSEGHPDKVADLISDCVLDAFLKQDSEARVAAETLVTSNMVVLAGEARTNASQWPNVEEVAREAVKSLGYEQKNFHWKTLEVINRMHQQSADIALGVDSTEDKEEGAGDQGMMFGYACDETETFMPAPIYYSHKILRVLAERRRSGSLPAGLLQDAKSQLTFEYENGRPVRVSKVVVSHQHEAHLTQGDVQNIILPVVQEVLGDYYQYSPDNTFINPTSVFVIGGPDGDTGLTGRKIIVDTYGGAAPHGGGAFSGKDPTKVDRSGAYIARYIAKNLVAAKVATRATIQLSYAIGKPFPLSIYVNFHDTGKVDEAKVVEFIRENIGLTPKEIRMGLRLNDLQYKETAAYGHFGRTPTANCFTWEKIDLIDLIQTKLL